VEDFLAWLDIIPGRNWLLLGPRARELAELVHTTYQPAGVTVAESPAAFGDMTFDVAVATEPSEVAELRRVTVPAGVVAVLRESKLPGLHAVQRCAEGVKGTR
jgi:hypothetical protein